MEQVKVNMFIRYFERTETDVGSFVLEQWGEIWAGERSGDRAAFVWSEKTWQCAGPIAPGIGPSKMFYFKQKMFCFKIRKK